MILLDTNAIYRLAGVEKDERLKMQDLQKFVFLRECSCSIYSVFEILKAVNFTFDEKKKVLDFLQSNNIMIEATDTINKEYSKLKLQHISKEELYNKLSYVYGEEIINQTYINISFFVIIYAYTSATIFLDHYEQDLTEQKGYFR